MTQIENQKSKIKNPYTPLLYAPPARRIKVLLISHTCQSRTEGQPKAHALAALPGIDLHLLTPRRWKHYGTWRAAQPPLDPHFQCTIAPVRCAWLGPAQYFLHYYPGLPRLLKTFQPDVIDLWEEPWGRVSAHACKLRNRLLPSAKIVAETEQNIDKKLPFPFERFRRFTLQNADYAVGRSAEAIAVLRAKGYTGPAQVVPNGVDTALFHPMDRASCREVLHEQLNAIENRKWGGAKIENPFFAGYAGRLVPEKGLLDLVSALPTAPHHVHLVFLGTGPLAPDLRRLAAELCVESRVHLLPARPLEKLPEFMNALDVFVLPSLTTPRWKEQFGRVIIEAHACGIPVIGTHSGAIPDVIADAGLVVPEHDPAELARALTTLAADPTRARALGQNGLRNAQSLFTWQTVAQTMAAIYKAVTA